MKPLAYLTEQELEGIRGGSSGQSNMPRLGRLAGFYTRKFVGGVFAGAGTALGSRAAGAVWEKAVKVIETRQSREVTVQERVQEWQTSAPPKEAGK